MTISIPMVDPAGEYRLLKAEIDDAVGQVFSSGRYVLGPQGEALEGDLAAYIGAPRAVGVNSGTDALHLALLAAGVGPGDEVVVPAFTFFASAEAVSYTGARPVFADIDPGTFNLSAEYLEKRISSRTKAVIAVHLFGQCCDLEGVSRLCREKELVLVEDCAQSLGADYDGRRGGGWGDFGCFSFYPTKNLGAAGDAGLVTTREHYDETLRMLRHHGSRKTYLHERVGWNSRLDEVQAAVLRVKFRHLERFNAARKRVAARYRRQLAGARDVTLPAEHGRGAHAYHQFTIRSPRRDALREALAREGIASSVFYPMPLHKQPAYEAANAGLALPNAEAAAREVLSLPIHPLLDDATVDRIAAVLRAAA